MKLQNRFECFAIGLVSLVMLSLLSSPLKAQDIYGSIVGTVTDSSGAVIPGAFMTLTNNGTNQKSVATTDAAGDYRFINLLPASYRLEVEKTGFRNLTRAPINVHAGGTVRINAALEVGAASETVQVTTATPLLQTESGTVSNVVEGTVVQQMPLNGRNVMNLIALTPGVVPQGQAAGAAALNGGIHTDITGWGNYQIGGDIAGEDTVYLDGAPIMGFGKNNVALIPTQDSIQEFRVANNAVSAEFGRFSGGVVQMTTKSGSNAWHGSAYEYVRNTVLNANNFFSNFHGQPRNAFHQNQFGVLAGGPIKKDKAFFMFSWEGFRLRMGVPTTTNFPTADMNAGKFYNRTLNTAAAPVGCITNGLSDAGGTYAQVSPSCFDPSAVAMSSYFPAPNSTGTNNYFINLPIPDNTSQYVGRVDYNVSSKQRIFGRYSYWNLLDTPPHLIAPKFDNGIDYGINHTHSFVLGDTYTINPTTVLDIRASYMREYFAHLPIALTKGGIDESQFGPAYAAMAPYMSSKLLPNLSISGPHSLYGMVGTNANSQDTYTALTLDANLTKIIGRHTLKFGGEIRYLERDGFGTNLFPSGFGIFNASTLGDEYAAFLLGEDIQDQIVTDRPTSGYNYYQGYYLQDAWQLTPTLTLNMGLRWELPGGIAEKKDRATVLLPNTVDPVTGDMGAIVLTDSSLYHSRSVIPVRLDLMSPRFSFAKRLGNATVVRGGYGLNYLPNDLAFGVMPFTAPINTATTASFGSYHSLSDPFNVLHGGSFLQPTGRSNPNFSQALLGQIVTSPVPQGMKYPYTQQWNLTVGRQWKGDWMTEVSYVGSKGTHMIGPGALSTQIDQYQGLDELSSQYYPTLQGMEQAGATKAQLIAYGQSHRPYPQYQDYVNTADYNGDTIYHGMYVVGEKRFHSGGVLHADFEWSKIIGNADINHFGAEGDGNQVVGFIQDFDNMKAERSLLSYDTPQRLVVSYVLPLPFGQGQKFAHYSGVAGALVSGWSADGITTFQSGHPLPLEYNGNYLSNYLGAGTIRPNYVAGCNKKTSGNPYQRFINNNWFNKVCFTYPGDFAFGNEPRVDPTLRAQGVDNFDFAAQKATKIKEQTDLQFRVEFFNLFNHVQFDRPGTLMAGGNYDVITSQANQPRLVQASLRLDF